MKKPTEKLDCSYLAAPTVNTTVDLLRAMEASKKVFEARKARFEKFVEKEKLKPSPNYDLLQSMQNELQSDVDLFNLAEKLIANTQYVEARLQEEFDFIKGLLEKEQNENIQLSSHIHEINKLRNAS